MREASFPIRPLAPHHPICVDATPTRARLEERLCSAEAITPALMADVTENVCTRLSALGNAAKARLHELIETGAWMDVVLLLLELELPQWKLRRIVREEDEWLCAISRHPWLPLELDEIAEASHENLPLALLAAFLDAKYMSHKSSAAELLQSRWCEPTNHLVVCDDFA